METSLYAALGFSLSGTLCPSSSSLYFVSLLPQPIASPGPERTRPPAQLRNPGRFPCVYRSLSAGRDSALPPPGGCAMKTVAFLALALVTLILPPVVADDALVRFEGGIGVHPVSRSRR